MKKTKKFEQDGMLEVFEKIKEKTNQMDK